MRKMLMNLRSKITVFSACLVLMARADDKFPLLTVNGANYTNVTVTTVTATDIFFTHNGGMDNARLKNLPPELQKKFNYNATNAAAVEKTHAIGNAQYHQQLLLAKPPPPPDEAATPAAPAGSGEDFVAPKLYARSVRGQPAPVVEFEKWLTPAPDNAGKFVLVDFWATWCGPCRRSIPELNAFQAKFGNRLVIIGISNESEADIKKMTSPQIDYSVAMDSQSRVMHALAVTAIPHCILIDPHGIVRYEGMPGYLDDAKLKHFLDKYGL